MAARGVHFAITEDELSALLACDGDAARLDYLQEEIEERLFHEAPDRVCESDKAWDAIHRALTDGTLEVQVGTAALAVLGGRHLYQADDYLMVLKSPAQVSQVADHLDELSEKDFRTAYDAIPAREYDGLLGDEDFDYTWSNFEDLRDFYDRASERGLHVLFTVDQ